MSLLAIIIYFFSNGKYIVPIAAWLAPIFVMRFWRSNAPKTWKTVFYTVFTVCTIVQWFGVLPAPGLLYIPIGIAIAFMLFIPYFVDGILYRKSSGFLSTLVFPTALVTTEYIRSFINPLATWGDIGVTQHSNLILLQLLSVTGVYGVAFVIGWTASVANWVWKNYDQLSNIKWQVIAYVSVMVSIALFGSVRLQFFPNHSKTVQISSISLPLRHVTDKGMTALNDIKQNKNASEQSIQTVQQIITKQNDTLFQLTALEAQHGSKVIFWSEVSGNVFHKDEGAFLDRASNVAKTNHIYLVVSYASLLHIGSPLTENKAVAFDPNGEKVLDYIKNNIVPGDHNVTGTTPLQTFVSPYGRIGVAICFDTDFPAFIHTLDSQKPDILLIPKNDWNAIVPLHTYMGFMRGIENGYSTVEQTGNGLSAAFDEQGNILSKMYNNDAGDVEVMVSHIPMKGTTTLYSLVGDVFAWLCILFLISFAGLTVWKLRRSKKSNQVFYTNVPGQDNV